jgi:hypothetical protein
MNLGLSLILNCDPLLGPSLTFRPVEEFIRSMCVFQELYELPLKFRQFLDALHLLSILSTVGISSPDRFSCEGTFPRRVVLLVSSRPGIEDNP